MRKRNRAVSAVILALTVAAVFSPFALVAEAAPDSTLAPITAKEVDVKKLSRDIFDEVNKLREKPSAAADVMTKMRDSAKPAPPNGLAITFPDASATHGDSRDFATLL